jgi:DNA-binding transcriptional ArsR family regulator
VVPTGANACNRSWSRNSAAILARGLRYGQQHMSVGHPSRSRLSSPRVRVARESLLNDQAGALVQSVREMICEPTRTQIVRVLSSGPLSVGDLAAILGRSKSATSQHLRVLRDSGVVSARRRGRAVIYSLTSAPMVETTVLVLNRAASIAAA